MGANIWWVRIHGGVTHFPIALVIASMLFDLAGYALNREQYSRDLHAAGFYAIVLGALASFAAVLSGLVLTSGEMLGSGMLLKHHVLMWPGFALLVAAAGWRLAARNRASRRAFAAYLMVAITTAALLSGAGYWGGEMMMAGTAPAGLPPPAPTVKGSLPLKGRALFAENCAPCHGASAQGAVGPNLRTLKVSDSKMEETIRSGVKGKMPAFGDQLSQGDIRALVTYVRSLKD